MVLPYEVILSSTITGKYSTEIVTAQTIEKAQEKAEKKYSGRYLIHDVHVKG